jgi:hypothetical protein
VPFLDRRKQLGRLPPVSPLEPRTYRGRHLWVPRPEMVTCSDCWPRSFKTRRLSALICFGTIPAQPPSSTSATGSNASTITGGCIPRLATRCHSELNLGSWRHDAVYVTSGQDQASSLPPESSGYGESVDNKVDVDALALIGVEILW